MAINILLAALALISTLAAFGGRTWVEGDAPLLKRITRRGYISLCCLACAFMLGVKKEIRASENAHASALEKQQLNEQLTGVASTNDSLRRSLGAALDSLSAMGTRINEGAAAMLDNNCAGLEDAFKLAAKIQREDDDCVVHLNGEAEMRITGRRGPMELYWGDMFECSVFLHGGGSPEGLALRAGGRTYALRAGHQDIRIYGSTPDAMAPVILNPRGLSGVVLKIFIKSTDTSRGQQRFRELVMGGQCAEYAKRTFRSVSADLARMRADAKESSFVRAQLTRGSFVRVLQQQMGWSEVRTPDGRQGWIQSDLLGAIE